MPGEKPLSPASKAKLTYEDFLLFPDDGRRHELIDGEHYVTPSPTSRHQVIVGNLYWIIRGYLEAQPIGRVFLAPFDVVFSQNDIVEPDLLYVSNDRLGVLTTKHVRGAPDLVIEVLSEGTRKRDQTLKRRLYEGFQVTEYWIVDPFLDTVQVFHKEGTRYASRGEYALERDDAFASPLFPSFVIRCADVFKP